MDQQKNINVVTLMLTAVAGYCDTVTFVSGDTIFSAHVTGNFIVFAYQMVSGGGIDAWIKLITFPVFIIAVITGGWMASRSKQDNKILLFEAILLIAAGILSVFFYIKGDENIVMYAVVMLVVFALGLQNAFGKLFSKATHGPTTMMTGNVTQASLDIGTLITNKFKGTDALISFKKQLITISGFLAGCVSGAFAGMQFGLAAVLLAGISMLFCYILSCRE